MIQSYINNLIVNNNRPAPTPPPVTTPPNYAFKFGDTQPNNSFEMFGFGTNPASTGLQQAFRTII